MAEADVESLWASYVEANRALKNSAERLRGAREALVSRLCYCYRKGEEWEVRAAWCADRMTDRCPFYRELRERGL